MNIKGFIATLLLSTSAFCSMDYVIEASTPAYATHNTSFAKIDQQQQQPSNVVANTLLGPNYEDKHPTSLALLLNGKSVDPIRLEIGFENILAKNIIYEISFLGRAVIPLTEHIQFFAGGKLGQGKSTVQDNAITFTGSSLLGGTASIEVPLPSSTKYSVSGAQAGFIYAVSKNLEIMTIFECIGKTASLSESVDRGSIARNAAAKGMNPIGILSALESIEDQTVLSYSANIGLRFRF